MITNKMRERVTSKNVNDMENNFTEIGSMIFLCGQIIFVVLMFESRPQFTQSLVSVYNKRNLL